MPEFCTCGARLPEDARFCHKCGKPQRDEPLMVEEAPPPPPLPPEVPVVVAPPIGFHNGPAVRIGLLVGALSILMSMLTGQLLMPSAFLVWLVVAGFLAVYLYYRRTGQRLSVMHGAHLGWLCGIFGFLITMVLATIVVVILSDPSVLQTMREQLKTMPKQEADINKMLETLRSPAGILTGLAVSFLLFTVLPAFGGAIGAKLLDRDRA